MTRRSHLFSFACIAACVALISAAALAQGDSYPSKPIKVIVPFPAGGAADLTTRTLGPKLTELLGQPIVVDNKPGANGIIGADAVAKSAPDGYTILFAPREVFGVNPSLYASLPYDPVKSFAHVAIVTEGPYVLVVNPSLGVKTVAELLAVAKTRQLSFGSFGMGSMGHLNLEAFAQATGIKLQHIPYKGAPAAVQAVVGGEVALAITTPPAALAFIRDGKLIALAAGSEKRLALLPEVPTLAEAGVSSDTLIPAYFAMAAPAGTSSAIIARLNAELRRALAVTDIAERFAKTGLIPAGSSPEAMTAVINQDIARFAALVKAIGIKPE